MIIKQHYVSAGYLAGFTFQGKRDSPFFVHSLDGSPVREDIPDHVGFERHYNTIDFPGLPPDHLEAVFHEFETPACALFKTLSAHPGRPFTTEGELAAALEFVALQAARVPQSKAKYESLIVDSGRMFMNKVAYSPEFFQEVVTAAERTGVLDDSIRQDSLREAVESGEIKVATDKSHLAVGILRLTSAIFDQISSMRSTLWYADGPDWFVCSDHPVGLFYSFSGNVFDDPTVLENPTVQLLKDTIYMPLARNVAVVLHRHTDVPAVQRAHRRMVAVVNALTISQAQRFIFSPTPDFICFLPGGRLGNARESIESLVSFREGNGEQPSWLDMETPSARETGNLEK